MKQLLERLDKSIYRFLYKNVNNMPNRFVKGIANFYPDARIRKRYFRRLGVVMGKDTYANLGFHIAINEVGDTPKIIIGDHVSIAPNVTMAAESCANNGRAINELSYVKNNLTKYGRIIIEDDVWIGAGVTILHDVRIGTCSVIGAGSVVTRDVEPYCVYAGAPARKIRDLREEQKRGTE